MLPHYSLRPGYSHAFTGTLSDTSLIEILGLVIELIVNQLLLPCLRRENSFAFHCLNLRKTGMSNFKSVFVLATCKVSSLSKDK